MTINQPTTIMALDVGERRIGVALASRAAKLAQPLTTLQNSPEIFDQLQKIIKDNHVDTIIVGRPRNLDGLATAQTKLTKIFANRLQQNLKLPVRFQDEAVTSHQAEVELKSKTKSFSKEAIDALAATYILEDYLNELVEVNRA